MQLKKLIGNEIIFMVSSVIIINILLISFSYAYFSDIDEGTNNEITFGNLALSLCQGDNCDLDDNSLGNILGLTTIENVRTPEKIYPMTDAQGLQQTPYTFIIKNTGDYDLYVKVNLTPDTTFDTTNEYSGTEYERFTNTDYSQIKIALCETGGTPTVKTYSSLIDYVIAENIFVEAGSQKSFTLYVWETNDADNDLQGTYFVTRLGLEGEYLIDE